MIEKLFSSPKDKTLALYNNKLKKINEFGQKFKLLTDDELKQITPNLKKRLFANEDKDLIINEAFALIREASERVIGLRHFDVQIIGGLVLTESNIAEMQTGEGKTLVAMLPTFFNALYGKGAHVVTVNDYLAKRDAEYVGQVHKFLGLTVGLIQEEMSAEERKENYACDITYLTNSQLGFDFLRDNLAVSADELVQRSFFYCIVDEVDSILIDEARTPLIISGTSEAPTEKYFQTAKLVTRLQAGLHYKVDEKAQNVILSSAGVSFCERVLGIMDLYNPNEPWISYILNSLKAKELYTRNKNYIVDSENEIIIVDEFTGRTMVGRRWSDGLHQAIEAKENVPIQEESQTLASISYQNLFLLYSKLAGMTGTAKTEEVELEKIYNLNVVQIPTNKPNKRTDFSDLIYTKQYVKWRAVAQECSEMYKLGRPVLIGTTTIEKSELIAALLSEYSIPYRLLNARPENVESESNIVALAGCKNAVTISTNMAGRGTDILLGGNPSILTRSLLLELFEKSPVFKDIDDSYTKIYSEYLLTLNAELKQQLNENFIDLANQPFSELEIKNDTLSVTFCGLYTSLFKQVKLKTDKEGQEVRQLGGLHVIGTERHESRRIDNQLRGRSGRQGDPGSSKFFLSVEDKLLRIFGGEQISNIMQSVGFSDDIPIQSQLLNKSLDSAQKKVEAYYFDTRKQVFEYDQALSSQRRCLYMERRRILLQPNLRNLIVDYAERSLYDIFYKLKTMNDEKLKNLLAIRLQNLLSTPFPLTLLSQTNELDQTVLFLKQQLQLTYDLKELELEIIQAGLLRTLEKAFILEQIDVAWKAHLQKIALLKDSIRWRAYGQKDPLTEYKKEAFNYYVNMLAKIRHRVVYFIMRAKIILYQT